MYCIRYRITAVSPLVISSKAGDMNMVTTERYIPGTSVIGILANRFITKRNIPENAHNEDDFFNGFLSGKLKISNAYIFSKDKDNKEFAYLPVPFSIQNKKGEKIYIYDLLYVNDDFDEQTEAINNFCILERDTLQIKSVETSLNFHHARDREKGISEDGKIFNYESLCPNQIFQGDISGAEADLQRLINICERRWTAYAGRSKNAQYGKILFEIIDEKPKSYSIKTEWDNEISLTFLSDTIIYNDNGFSVVDTDTLEKKYLGEGVKIRQAFVKKGDIETFVGVWQLRRPSESCFLAGSVFLLDISESDTTKLAELQKTGIGERTHEGFGRCIFGLQTYKKELNETEKDPPETKKPDFPMPEETRNLLIALIKNTVKKEAELMALRDQNEFKRRPPSNSLLGRLEAILKANNEQNNFKKALEKLKKSARDKLERCNNGKKTLFEFLKEDKNFIGEIKRNENVVEMCKEIDYNFETDDTLGKELYQIYFETFFSMMRKRTKTEKGDG